MSRQPGFARFLELPTELQGKIWRYAAWSSSKGEQAQLVLISHSTKSWTRDVLFHTIIAGSIMWPKITAILQDDNSPVAPLFREKVRYFWISSYQVGEEVVAIIKRLKALEKLYVRTHSQIIQVLENLVEFPKLREIGTSILPWLAHAVKHGNNISLGLSKITHLLITQDYIYFVSLSNRFSASFPELTHFGIYLSGSPDPLSLMTLCEEQRPEVVVVFVDACRDENPLAMPLFKTSRKVVVIRGLAITAEWSDYRYRWENSWRIWDIVDSKCQRLEEADNGKPFVEIFV
ncbi:hypothetical protein DL96DRAFT_1640914 [Flagelloscypha sp. PMI_526]|nr:hypothetical protein DL96DRAFT_1640914 [Flagelloscypha sp. PMI_526]